ncbi:hypothetical protein GCM10010293_61290 [Streptomyces griseoflavus]|nr:hypothetical protein GCM10010293_61290 [Streptomyces griseoflavus]
MREDQKQGALPDLGLGAQDGERRARDANRLGSIIGIGPS